LTNDENSHRARIIGRENMLKYNFLKHMVCDVWTWYYILQAPKTYESASSRYTNMFKKIIRSTVEKELASVGAGYCGAGQK
jgi:hypothetical protein